MVFSKGDVLANTLFCQRRRKQILSLHLQGIRGPTEVLNALEETDLLKGLVGVDAKTGILIDPPAGRVSRLRRITKDIHAVKTELHERLSTTPDEMAVELGLYRRRLEAVLRRAMKLDELGKAIDAIKLLAISAGIDTAEPIRIEHGGEVKVDLSVFEQKMADFIAKKFDDDADIDDLFGDLRGERVFADVARN